MEFKKSSKYYVLNKTTYVNLRWIGIIGQFITINSVKFIFEFNFDYILANFIILIAIITNFFLIYFYKENQLSSRYAFKFLLIDILQLTFLLYISGGILNPFSVFLLIPSVFASSNLDVRTNLMLICLTILSIIFLTFFFNDLPFPLNQLEVSEYYYYSEEIDLGVFNESLSYRR